MPAEVVIEHVAVERVYGVLSVFSLGNVVADVTFEGERASAKVDLPDGQVVEVGPDKLTIGSGIPAPLVLEAAVRAAVAQADEPGG